MQAVANISTFIVKASEYAKDIQHIPEDIALVNETFQRLNQESSIMIGSLREQNELLTKIIGENTEYIIGRDEILKNNSSELYQSIKNIIEATFNILTEKIEGFSVYSTVYSTLVDSKRLLSILINELSVTIPLIERVVLLKDLEKEMARSYTENMESDMEIYRDWENVA